MKVLMSGCFAVSVALAGAAQPTQADEPYLDDRSDAVQLIRSLYNAVNRHEYARAFDYFSSPPAKSFEAYVQGYADTEAVAVITGEVLADGAAGSTYFTVPTAIRAEDAKGGTSYFSGCYTVRAVNASVQDPPFRPLRIESAKLKVSKADSYNRYSLPECGDGGSTAEEGPPDDATLLAQAKAAFGAEMAKQCDKTAETLGGANEPDVFKIGYKPDYAGADEPETIYTLFAFACSMAAYNSSEVYYGHDSVSGLRRVSFASPHLAITYADEENAALKSMVVEGFTSDDMLTNSEYDPATRSIHHFAKWRGIGDASSNADYRFVEGQFVLTTYDVDPTTDGEMNAYSIVKDGKVQPEPELLPEQ